MKVERFLARLQATAELIGQPLSDVALAMLAKDLSSFTERQVEGALENIRREHEGRLTLRAILDAMPAAQPGRWARIEYTPPAPVPRRPLVPTNPEAIAEAGRRVSNGMNNNVYAALRDIADEREVGR